MDMLKGFRNFIMRGNVIDLAVGVIIGAAFNGIVNSLVKDLFTPLIGALVKVNEFSSWTFTLHGSKILIGDFINSVVSFLLVATAVYFFIVVPVNKISSRFHKEGEPTTKECPFCTKQIPFHAKRCPECTSELS